MIWSEGPAAAELRAAGRQVRDAEAAYTDQVLILVETIRRLREVAPEATDREVSKLCGQPIMFVRMARGGVVQTSLHV